MKLTAKRAFASSSANCIFVLIDDGLGFALQAKRHARADVSASRSHRSCAARVLAEIGHSHMQDRPANSATPMLQAGQTGPELGFRLNAWPGRRDAARP